jgi:uncharacterized membrane protein required for colicin V production
MSCFDREVNIVSVNWVTVILVVVLVGSAVGGAIRGIANEAGSVLSELISIAASIVSLWIAWSMSRSLAAWVLSSKPGAYPSWQQQLVEAWRSSPVAAEIVTFLALYLISSSVIRNLLRFIPIFVAQRLRVSGGRWLGGGLGAVIGGVRCVLIGGLLFGVLEYFSLPALSNMAHQSSLYQFLEKSVYKPYLTSVFTKDLPVLATGAFEPITKNITLFVVPTSLAGDGRGLLVVPNQIAKTAQEITKDKTSDRDKAYALYEWESHNIHYDWRKYNDFVYRHQWDAQSPLDTLSTHKGVCADYALLYADMAHAVGLSVKIDEGIGEAFGQSGPHAWNEVYDPKTHQWIPLDTTWGSEMDMWFGTPGFDQTHRLQRSIVISGGAV